MLKASIALDSRVKRRRSWGWMNQARPVRPVSVDRVELGLDGSLPRGDSLALVGRWAHHVNLPLTIFAHQQHFGRDLFRTHGGKTGQRKPSRFSALDDQC